MKSNVIPFQRNQAIYADDDACYDYEKPKEPSEIAAKLAIFEAFMYAMEDRSEADVLLSLESKNLVNIDRARLHEYVRIGFRLWDHGPDVHAAGIFSMDI